MKVLTLMKCAKIQKIASHNEYSATQVNLLESYLERYHNLMRLHLPMFMFYNLYNIHILLWNSFLLVSHIMEKVSKTNYTTR